MCTQVAMSNIAVYHHRVTHTLSLSVCVCVCVCVCALSWLVVYFDVVYSVWCNAKPGVHWGVNSHGFAYYVKCGLDSCLAQVFVSQICYATSAVHIVTCAFTSVRCVHPVHLPICVVLVRQAYSTVCTAESPQIPVLTTPW